MLKTISAAALKASTSQTIPSLRSPLWTSAARLTKVLFLALIAGEPAQQRATGGAEAPASGIEVLSDKLISAINRPFLSKAVLLVR